MSLSQAAVIVLALEKNVNDLNVFHEIMNKSFIHSENRLHMYLKAHLVFVKKISVKENVKYDILIKFMAKVSYFM